MYSAGDEAVDEFPKIFNMYDLIDSNPDLLYTSFYRI